VTAYIEDRSQMDVMLYNISAIKLKVNTNLHLILISSQATYVGVRPIMASDPIIHNDFVLIVFFIVVGREWHLSFTDVRCNKPKSYKLGRKVTRSKKPFIDHPLSKLIFQMFVKHNNRFSYVFEINCAENTGSFLPMHPISIMRPAPVRKVHVNGVHYDQSVGYDTFIHMDGGGNIYSPRWQTKNTYDIFSSILIHRRYR
jgi:hypothetical protein